MFVDDVYASPLLFQPYFWCVPGYQGKLTTVLTQSGEYRFEDPEVVRG